MIPGRPRTIVLVTGGVVLFGGAGLAAVGFGDSPNATPARSTLPPATAEVKKTTLTETEDVDGTLGYGDAATLTGVGGGTVTWLAPEGGTVTRGKPVYKVDTKPIPLLYGSLPLYRTLRSGVEGADVLQFERNLSALGYTGFTIDDTFSSATAAAVEEWQEDLGVSETGTVEPGSVVVAPRQIRIAEHKKAVGDQAGGPLLTHTGTTRIVTVDLSVELQRLAKKGRGVEVEMPDGETTQGKITKVGAVATQPAEEEGGSGEDEATIEVLVSLRSSKSAGGLDQAPVTVRLTAEQRRGVLAVPVAALLALPEGGYGVQVVEGSAVRTVPVEVGMFADGKVEISGSGLAAGMKVGMPK